jgi:hypothetical protein
LTDILSKDADRVRRAWESSQAAGEFAPIPAGEYVADVVKGELALSRSNSTPGYSIEFAICQGEHRGRKVWLNCWLTEPAMPQAKRDLGKLGIKSLEQLDRPLPPGIRCRLRVTLRRDDTGAEYNRITMFEVIEVSPPRPDAFAPAA